MNLSPRATALAALMVALIATGANADVIISAADVTLNPGDTGTMDFLITSNAGDTLADFGLQLQIVPIGSPTALLQFTPGQSDPYGNPNYVFYQESSNQDNVPTSIPFFGAPTPTVYANDTISGGDSDDSVTGFVPLPATSGGPFSYLATVSFQVPSTASGDSYQIVLVRGANTYFDAGDSSSLDPSYTPATVHVRSVPEPASLAACLVGGSILAARRLRRRRRPGATR